MRGDVGHRSDRRLLDRQYVDQFVFAISQPQPRAEFGDQVRVLERTVQLPEGMSLACMHLHRQGNILFDQFHLGGGIQHGAIDGHDVIRSKDACIRQDRHGREPEAVTHWRHVCGKRKVSHLLGLEAGKDNARRDGTGFLEGVEIDRRDLYLQYNK